MKNKNTYIQIGLVLSLVLNGFFLGFIMAGPHGFGPPPDPSKRMVEAAMHLKPENRDNVMAILDRHMHTIDSNMQQGMNGFQNIRNILTAKNVDFGKLDTALSRMSKHHQDMGASMDAMLKEIAAAIPDAQERKTFFNNALPPAPPFPPKK